eukprot:3566669-Rhodomonas_salina.2
MGACRNRRPIKIVTRAVCARRFPLNELEASLVVFWVGRSCGNLERAEKMQFRKYFTHIEEREAQFLQQSLCTQKCGYRSTGGGRGKVLRI